MGAQSDCRIKLKSVFNRQWSPHSGSVSWHPIITIACVRAFSLSIKVIRGDKGAHRMCTRRENHMHVQTHWPQEKDITTNTPHTHTHLKNCPPPPPPVQTPRVHTCVLMRGRGGGGAGGLEKGGKVPVRCLLNTFVSTTRRDKHHRQAAARSRHRRRGKQKKTKNKTPLGGWNVVHLVKGKDGRCISMINSVLIPNPGPV